MTGRDPRVYRDHWNSWVRVPYEGMTARVVERFTPERFAMRLSLFAHVGELVGGYPAPRIHPFTPGPKFALIGIADDGVPEYIEADVPEPVYTPVGGQPKMMVSAWAVGAFEEDHLIPYLPNPTPPPADSARVAPGRYIKCMFTMFDDSGEEPVPEPDRSKE